MIQQRTATRGRTRHVARAAIALGLVTAAVACGSDDEGSASTTPAGASTTGGPATADGGSTSPGGDCGGPPLRFASIFSLTGPATSAFEGIEPSIEAAVAAVNDQCELGRPIEVDVCDDKSDPNEAAACGRKAVDEGALAIIGHAGAFDDGVGTAQLPAFTNGGGTTYMTTSPLAFIPQADIGIAYGVANVSKALGASDLLWVASDLPVLQVVGGLTKAGADAAKVPYDSIFFPPDTTDYASLAAQIASKQPTAIAFVAQQPEPFLKALRAEGITPDDTVMITMTPVSSDQIAAMGDLVEGVYSFGSAWPYADTSNEGIAQMHEEMAAAGQDDSKVQSLGVAAWSIVHSTADALRALTPEQLDALEGDEQAFADALVAKGTYDRPELAPYDLSKRAYTEADNPFLGKFPIYSRSGIVIQVEDGQNTVVSDGYVDFSTSFTLDRS